MEIVIFVLWVLFYIAIFSCLVMVFSGAIVLELQRRENLVNIFMLVICISVFATFLFNQHYYGGLNTWHEFKEYELLALQDNTTVKGNISGGIFFVHGTIEGTSMYQGYYEDEQGIHQINIPSEGTIIHYSDEKKITRIQRRQECREPKLSFFSLYPLCRILESCENDDWVDAQMHHIYIPRGSIIQDITLDAK